MTEIKDLNSKSSTAEIKAALEARAQALYSAEKPAKVGKNK